MAELEVKMERKSEIPLFVDEGKSNPFPKPELSPPPDTKLLPTSAALYKREQETLLQQVEVEEQSVELFLASFQDLKQRLQKYINDLPYIVKLIEGIDGQSSRKRECRVTAGVVGATGLGKSTLLNAVLGMRELLPTDNGQACTSAIIEVLWNPKDSPASDFEATIIFLQAADWKIELEQLYKDLDALDCKDTGDDDDMDFELGTRFEAVMAKARAVYPQIEHKHDLKKTTVAKLMRHESVRNLGQELVFTGQDRKKFCSHIRPFIVSSTATQQSAPWPLVKIAKIYVKCELLKDGLVLVDIPGNMDTNPARNALAEMYQRELSVSCILAQSKRAASDQAAQINLSETYKRHLQLDGRWKSDNIIFIVVRTDESITISDHIDKNPLVAEKLVRVFAKEKTWNEDKASLQREMNIVHVSINQKLLTMKTLNSEIRSLFDLLKIIPAGMRRRRGEKLVEAVLALPGVTEADKANTKELAKLRDDREKTRSALNSYRGKINNMQNKCSRIERLLEDCKSEKTRACIEDRSRVQIMAIRAYFERISHETGNKECHQSLPVHCVSASKYLDFLDGSPPSCGFPQIHNTQIPQLQKTLAATTLEVRQRNSKVTLHNMERLAHVIQSWAKDINTPRFHLSLDEWQILEDRFEQLVNEALDSFSKLHINTSNLITEAIQYGMFASASKIESKAALTAEDTAKGWSKLHVSTLRAIIQRKGEFQSATRKEPYSLNCDLAGNYLDVLMPSWTAFFDKKLLAIRGKSHEAAKSILRKFSEDIANLAKDICPQITELLRSLGENVKQLQTVLQKHYSQTFDTKIPAVRATSHRLIMPRILKSMKNSYQTAAAEKGKGYARRVQQILRTSVKDNGVSMFKKSTEVLKDSLVAMVAMINVDLDHASDDLIVKARELFQLILDSHVAIADPDTQQILTAAKVELLKDVNAVFDNLALSLVENIRVPMNQDEMELPCYDVDAEPSPQDDADFDETDGDEYVDTDGSQAC